MSLNSSFKDKLQRLVASPVMWDAPLSAWTTLRIGGPAAALVIVNEVEELQSVITLCREQDVNWDLLGKGSNILASDSGYQGVIIILGNGFKFISAEKRRENLSVLVTAGAATSLTRIGDWAVEQGAGGFEFAAGIPGTIGGALAMNAGAWGTEIGSLVRRVELVGGDGRKTLSSDTLRFSYRSWDDLKTSLAGYVVVAVTIELIDSHSLEIQQKMKEYRSKRRGRQPVGMPNAGSFFKNPGDKSAGQLIDESGLKGSRVGDAEVSEKHANFFVNRGQATASEMIELMHLVQEQVKRKTNILLEPEVYFLK